MRRIRITALATIALLAIAPASALARGHHQRSHRHHVRHGRIKHFGDVAVPSDNAGTIKSLRDGVLTISLADGSTVSGRVTGDTEVECMTSLRDDMSRDGGGDQGGDGSGDHQGSGDQGDGGQGDDGGAPEEGAGCSMADLTSGASVREADLAISSGGGAVWRKIELGA